jgi:hypothetical protein
MRGQSSGAQDASSSVLGNGHEAVFRESDVDAHNSPPRVLRIYAY